MPSFMGANAVAEAVELVGRKILYQRIAGYAAVFQRCDVARGVIFARWRVPLHRLIDG